MPAGIGQKYHCGLAQVDTSSVMQGVVGYLLRGNTYNKMDDDTFTPRFGTGQEGLNNLDLWKTYQHVDFSGGALQVKYRDTTKLAAIRNGVYNPSDEMVYPTKAPTSESVPGAGVAANMSVNNEPGYVMFRNEMYIIANRMDFGAVAKWNGTSWAMVKSDFADQVRSIAVFNDKLWVATNGAYWGWDGTTWTSLGSTAAPVFTLICPFKGKMYASGKNGQAEGNLYSHDGTPGAATNTLVGAAGDNNKRITKMLVFNHRLYLGKQDGLFAYDGVQISCILDYSHDQDTLNFSMMDVFNGVLYFVAKNTLYRYNGSTIEKVQSFDNTGTIQSLDSAYGRLWVSVKVPDSTKGGINVYTYDWYYFDGIGFFHYFTPPFQVLISATVQNQPVQAFYEPNKQSMIFRHGGSAGGGGNSEFIYAVSMQQEFWTGLSNDLTIDTSEFDAGFPYIDKYTDSCTLTYENAASGDTLTVYFNIHDGNSWSGWSSTIGGTYKRIKMRIVIHRQTSSSAIALKSFSFRYYLSPNLKRKWTMTFLCQGNSDNPLELLDGSTEANTPKVLRNQIYACRENDVPSIWLDVDTCKGVGSQTSGATTINVDTTNTFPTSGYAYNDRTGELFLYTGKTATSFTGVTRGRWGTAAAAMNADDVIVAAYRVVITKINAERMIAPNITDGIMDTYGNETELSVTMREA